MTRRVKAIYWIVHDVPIEVHPSHESNRVLTCPLTGLRRTLVVPARIVPVGVRGFAGCTARSPDASVRGKPDRLNASFCPSRGSSIPSRFSPCTICHGGSFPAPTSRSQRRRSATCANAALASTSGSNTMKQPWTTKNDAAALGRRAPFNRTVVAALGNPTHSAPTTTVQSAFSCEFAFRRGHASNTKTEAYAMTTGSATTSRRGAIVCGGVEDNPRRKKTTRRPSPGRPVAKAAVAAIRALAARAQRTIPKRMATITPATASAAPLTWPCSAQRAAPIRSIAGDQIYAMVTAVLVEVTLEYGSVVLFLPDRLLLHIAARGPRSLRPTLCRPQRERAPPRSEPPKQAISHTSPTRRLCARAPAPPNRE